MKVRTYTVFLHVSLFALVAVSLALVRQNQQLRGLLSPETPQIEAGDAVGPVEVASLAGDPGILSWNDVGRDRLLLVFTTTCPACEQNQAAWQALYDQVGHRLEVIGISLDGPDATRAYRQARGLLFDVVTAADPERFIADYEIPAVPFTLHVGSDGQVRGAWRGGLSADQLAEVRSGA